MRKNLDKLVCRYTEEPLFRSMWDFWKMMCIYCDTDNCPAYQTGLNYFLKIEEVIDEYRRNH